LIPPFQHPYSNLAVYGAGQNALSFVAVVTIMGNFYEASFRSLFIQVAGKGGGPFKIIFKNH
jgi:hypothetical protein